MNDNEFPRMLYRNGGHEEIHGGRFTAIIVESEAALEQALAGGFHLTTTEAVDADKATTSTTTETDGDPKPATHAELKQKATEMGLTFAHNISKAALSEMIDQALAGGAKD